MDVEERRAIAERARRRALSEGIGVDKDPELAGWIDEWIAGEIDIGDVVGRYAIRQKRESGEE